MYISRVYFYYSVPCKLLSCFENTTFTINGNINRITTVQLARNWVSSAMLTQHNLTKPPESVRGMTVLDKSKFDNLVTIPVLNIKDAKISDLMPHVKKYAFKMPKLKPLQPFGNGPGMCILLNPETIKTWFDLQLTDREALEKLAVNEANFSELSVTITYDNYNATDIFKSVLPSDQEGFSSFSQIGHIIHVNLREHLWSYKNLIAQVLLDKIPNTRTIVNKVDMIDNTYRNFSMELLSGEDNMMVNIKENRCEFQFDFSKIYWNPRLSTEHERIVKMLQPGDVLFDIFAGVGPFSIPAAKKKCIVFANDLNPDSYHWLNHNLKKNKVDAHYLKTYNRDGRDFILDDFKVNLVKYINKYNVHVVMNLPALAVEFLSAFCKLYQANEIGEITNPPLVHVYCFAKGENYIDLAKNAVIANVGYDISDKIVDIFRVRTVSSLKEMMRVTFKLDSDILVAPGVGKRKHDDCNAGAAVPKKCVLL